MGTNTELGRPEPGGSVRRWQPRTSDDDASAAWDLLLRARQDLTAGNLERALAHAQRFIDAKPLEPEGYFWEGVIYDELDDHAAALRSYKEAVDTVLKAGMDSADLRVNLGNALLKLGKGEDAIWQFRRAIEIDSRLAMAHLNLGRAYLEKEEPAKALECFQHCRELHCNAPQLYYYSAKAYKQLGRTAEAQAQAEQALEKLPAGPTREHLARELAREFAANAQPDR